MTPRKQLLPLPLEKDFQAVVVELAELYGWLVYHTHDSRGSQKGFPDLVLLRGTRLLFVELKRSLYEKLEPDQERWKDALGRASQVCFLWAPEQWDEIQTILR